jgi:hypothetical protein
LHAITSKSFGVRGEGQVRVRQARQEREKYKKGLMIKIE